MDAAENSLLMVLSGNAYLQLQHPVVQEIALDHNEPCEGSGWHDFSGSKASNIVMVLDNAMVTTVLNSQYSSACSEIPHLAHRLRNVIWN